MPIENEPVDQRVARGAALLDAVRPGWASLIDLRKLQMNSCDHCVLGQLHADYIDGCHALGIEHASGNIHTYRAARCGFEAPSAAADLGPTLSGEYRELTEAWTDLITKRQRDQ